MRQKAQRKDAKNAKDLFRENSVDARGTILRPLRLCVFALNFSATPGKGRCHLGAQGVALAFVA